MAVNKNFVVKNGIEVAEDLIFANSDLDQVGIGSTIPTTTLDVKGQGIAAEDGKFTGILTATSELNVGLGGTVIRALGSGLIGLGTASPKYNVHVVRPNPELPGYISTSMYVDRELTVSGRVEANAISLDEAVDTVDLNATGITTIANGNITGNLEVTNEEVYTRFDVVNSGVGAYQFNATGIGFTQNTNNPVLYLDRGQNYRFNVNASGHPFLIKTLPGTGTGNVYNDGVENNGAQVGIVTFKVPFNSPNTLYYQCQLHASMVGVIIVGSTGDIGIQSEDSLVGSASSINFKSSTGGGVEAIVTAGVATVTITPGVSIGLAIALGG